MDTAYQYNESVRKRACEWVELKLSDEASLGEDLWGNYIEGGLEVHPSREEIDTLVPKVKEALIQAQPLPEMNADVAYAFLQYLARYDREVFASEYANSGQDEDWSGARSLCFLKSVASSASETVKM